MSSYQNKLMNVWNQNELIGWIQSLATDASFSSSVKQQIIDGVKKYATENNSEVTGLDFFEAEDASDIKEMVIGIDSKKSRSLFRKIGDKKQEEFDIKQKEKGAEPGTEGSNDNNTEIVFALNVIGKQGTCIPLKGMTKKSTVAQVKAKYLEEEGNQTAADNYRSGKWDSKDGKISLKYGGKSMDNDRTLESYGIVNALGMPPVVGFHVIGGSNELKCNDADKDEEEDDEDKYRKRKLRRKKHKGIIKLSSKADCIMGYTDCDGIPRAEMPCGCAIAADTMYRYLKSLFEKDYKSTKLICPTPKKLCKGNDQQREWKWSIIFAVADCSQKEIVKYSKIINNRVSGSKSCPFCSADTERPNDLRIWRVRCTQCNNSDWCWSCSKKWNASGLGPICGNKNCMGAQINNLLKQCDNVKPPWSDIKNKGGEVPQVRACPKCCTTLEYTSACKHMWCLCCPHEFCFNCLGKWNDECSHSKECELADVQEFN